jgi:UDP-N-acetylmuramyl pentapeptide phosphotransferase/UDP-N-acetylglucosamine-1-phosphate transferase
MTFYSLLALSAFMLTLLGTRLTIITFRKRVLPIDPLSLRADYKKPPMNGGGLSVVMSLIICLLVADISYAIILAMFLLTAMALLDDLIRIPLPIRLLIQLLCVLIAINVVGKPVFGGHLPPWLDTSITAALWVWFINVFYIMDGIDGMSPMEMVSIAMGACLLAALTGRDFPDPLMVYSLIIVAAGCGFLWWNWHPAKILMNAVGAVPIGFLMGYLLLLAASSGYAYAAMILPAYYLSDATITTVRHFCHRRRLFARHNDYYYLRAIRSGRRQDAVVRYIFGINFLLIFQAVYSVIDPDLSIFYVALAYASVFMMLGFFAHTAHDPDYEPF